ncbi:MAG: hypothetical protein QME96_08115, partial [Myxococcota bacterium]|nr:hypothetical protein [Myxococcota bacterium]
MDVDVDAPEPVAAAADRRGGFARRPAGYARFVRLSHTLFSLPLLVAGTVLGAAGIPSARTLALALLAG